MLSNASIRGPLSLSARRVAGLTLFLAVAASRQAVADDDAERKLKAFHALRPFASAVEGAKATGDFGGFGDDVAACRAAIKDGAAAGYQPLDTFTATLLWKHVGTNAPASRIASSWCVLLDLRGTVAREPVQDEHTFRPKRASATCLGGELDLGAEDDRLLFAGWARDRAVAHVDLECAFAE